MTGRPDASRGRRADRPLVPIEMLPEVVADLARDIGRLNQMISDHQAQLQALDDAFKKWEADLNKETPSRWAWRWLTQHQAAELWSELSDFVNWIIERHELTSDLSIPPCWYQHPSAVEDLTALYAAWRAAYCDGDIPSTELIAWRDRWFWPALERLNRYANWRECKESHNHQPAIVRAEATDPGLDKFVQVDLASRPSEPT